MMQNATGFHNAKMQMASMMRLGEAYFSAKIADERLILLLFAFSAPLRILEHSFVHITRANILSSAAADSSMGVFDTDMDGVGSPRKRWHTWFDVIVWAAVKMDVRRQWWMVMDWSLDLFSFPSACIVTRESTYRMARYITWQVILPKMTREQSCKLTSELDKVTKD
jgi:hypothetical protein